ncbi:MAG: FAD/NAD(P)-binding protein [Rubrivivax sp.]
MTPAPAEPEVPLRRVVIVGGGFTGACVTVQLLRHGPPALRLTLVDPAERPGRGLAYRTADPDHRLNAPSFGHSLLPDDAWHFSRWIVQQRLREQDPESVQADGTVYVRRVDFGRYLEETLAAQSQAAGAPAFEHRRAMAVALSPRGQAPAVQLDDGRWLAADLVIVATGNPPPRRPREIGPALATHPALHADPIGDARLHTVDRDAAVLVLGSGLTALDQLSTLLRQGHRGPLTVLSRHALQPRPNASPQGALAAVRRLEDLDALPPDAFVQRFAAAPPVWVDRQAPAVRAWLRALRRRVRQVQAAGGPWQAAFDELRDAVWQLWPLLPAAEKRRFLQRLRPWYDVHRFRSPPPNDVRVAPALARGQLRFVAGRLLAVRAEGAALVVRWQPPGAAAAVEQPVQALVNCSGLDTAAMIGANALLASGCALGRLRPDPCGLGVEVDAQCSALDADGRPDPGLRVLGPPSAGRFGDPLGAVFIGAQVQRVLPDLLARLA